MLYPRCPTCGFLLANLELEYEAKREEICLNPDLTEEEREQQQQALINSFGLKRYCCKMRLLSYTDLIHLIVWAHLMVHLLVYLLRD